MRYLASLAMLLVLASGCSLIFDGGSGDDVCAFDLAEPAAAPAPQRNPETLTCESFGGGGCNPDCGPCPLADQPALAPLPSWGFCGSTCEALSETACASDPACRVVKDAACAVSAGCTTDFLGCFPTNQFTDPAVACFAAHDGFTCSLSAACTAYHRGTQSGLEPPILQTFAMCAPEGKSPGTCFGQVTCKVAAPACPPETMPGVASGCYTGACIPLDVCGPALRP
jgi:hypothetical protein